MQNRRPALTAALLALGFTLACAKSEAPSAAPAPKSEAPKAAALAAPAADSTGVAECDTYLRNYTACLDSKVPEASRAAMRAGFDQTRAAWKAAAANPAGKDALRQGCIQATEAAKAALKPYGCDWP